MEFENLITLIKTVSDSSVSEFEFEQNGAKVSIKKNEKVYCQEVVPVMTTVATAGGQKAVQENVDVEYDAKIIKSPLIGRFYVAPAEDAEPFVSVGDSIKKGQTVAIVEAMKLMNDIESEFDGVIEEVLVENGETVEYGQPLFKVR